MSSSITGRRLCGAVPYDCSGETTVYTAPTDTGNTVSRHFVQPAGSPVFSTNYALADMVFLWASCLDDLENFQPGVVVHGRCRPNEITAILGASRTRLAGIRRYAVAPGHAGNE